MGNVGRALATIIAHQGANLRVVLIGDSSGSLADPNGFSPFSLVDLAAQKGSGARIADLSGAASGAASYEAALCDAIERARAGKRRFIHVELGPTELSHGGSARSRCERALKKGARVACAAKGPLVAGWEALVAAAGGETAFWENARFSASVGAGLPLIEVGRQLALGSPLNGIVAALNGTSNLVLGLMEEGATLEEAVRLAQSLGMAEADPANDLDGWDQAAKLVILARAVFGVALPLEAVERESVRNASATRLADAHTSGCRLRAIGRLRRSDDGKLAASVRLEKVPMLSPLASGGGNAAALFDTAWAGEVLVSGRGAGPRETASAVYRDIRILARGT